MGRGLALLGKPGVGKTFAMCVLGNELARREVQIGYTTVEGYLKRERALIDLRAKWAKSFGDVDAEEEWDSIRTLHENMRDSVTVLLIDDVGKEHTTATGYAEDEIDYLMRYRFDAALPTLITSNIPAKQWGAKYSPAMASFIKEAFVLATVSGDDMRDKKQRR